jgi:hypothetical protein
MELHFFAQQKVAENQVSMYSFEAGNSEVFGSYLLRLRLFRHGLDDFYSQSFTQMGAGSILDADVLGKKQYSALVLLEAL